MAMTMINETIVLRAIQDAVRAKIEIALEKVIEDAKAQVEQTIRAQADTLALDLLSEYQVYSRDSNIIITVRKGERNV